jgi:hypothetical protein
MRIQRVLMPGSGAEWWTVLGDDCPYGESGSCHRIPISPGVERHQQEPRLFASPIRGPSQAVGRQLCSARSLIPRSIRWVIAKATTTATGSTMNDAQRWV